MSQTAEPERIVFFDTTLRDGEQSPGASMTLHEKIRIAELLEELGVDVIEAGFPIASSGDFEAVNEISRIVREPIICALARAGRADIERAAAALAPARRRRIHTFIATSPLHMKHKLQMKPDEVHDAVIDSVSHARRFTDDVDWSPEDGSRSDPDFLCRCVEAAIRAGATCINLPDTVGYAIPEEFGGMIRMLRERVPNSDKAVFSAHCHNDLGLAVANSLAAIEAGARQVECTINGLGERAGNAALEEIVMALRTRQDLIPYGCGINTEVITRISRLVSNVTGFAIQPNKAIVGANAFAHEAGIHQHGVMRHAGTYEIMTPDSIGLARSTLVMGKHSGRHAFREKIRELGYQLGENAVQDAFRRFKDLADRKKTVYDEDIIALIDDAASGDAQHVKFVSLRVVCGSVGPQTAELELEVAGSRRRTTSEGDGPVDAIFNAVGALYPHEARLKLYQVHAVTEGTDAQAEVTVRLEDAGHTANGHGTDTDTLVASTLAYVNALNKLPIPRRAAGATAAAAAAGS